jgi:ABC-2 type transport system permease protein
VIVFFCFIDREWKFNPANNGINTDDIYASILLLFGATIIVALAVALSARFNIVVTLSACIGIFLLGLVSAYVFARFEDVYLAAKIGKYLVPDLQVFWISDAIYEDNPVPAKYIAIAASYTLCYTGGILALAIALFQRRQVG